MEGNERVVVDRSNRELTPGPAQAVCAGTMFQRSYALYHDCIQKKRKVVRSLCHGPYGIRIARYRDNVVLRDKSNGWLDGVQCCPTSGTGQGAVSLSCDRQRRVSSGSTDGRPRRRAGWILPLRDRLKSKAIVKSLHVRDLRCAHLSSLCRCPHKLVASGYLRLANRLGD
jgi:hypothetical protein